MIRKENRRISIQKLSILHKELYGFDDPYLVERVFQCLKFVIPYILQWRSIVVADFGCGDLRASNLIHSQLSKRHDITSFHCIDMFSVSEKNSEKFEIFNHDLNQINLKIPDNSVNLAYALEVIEHLWNVDIFVSETHRILKSQGIFLITTPNLAAWYNRVLFPLGILPIHYEVSFKNKYGRVYSCLGERSKAVGHIRLFTPFALSRLLEDNGFEILTCKGLQFMFQGFPSILDRAFTVFPSLSSMFMILAKKR
ncbi:MAG: methyltransferase domain-containing protein [Candidatus Hodarchaeota archaeon]